MGHAQRDDIKILGHFSVSVCQYVCLCVQSGTISKFPRCSIPGILRVVHGIFRIFINLISFRRFALNSVDGDVPLAVLNGDLFDDDDKTADCKVEWENRYNATLSDFAAELALLDSVPCCLTFSSEDASRSWHGRDGQPMPLWTAPSSAAAAVAMMESGTFQVRRTS